MNLKIGTARSEPGARTYGVVKVTTMLDGGDLAIPIHIVTGTKPGPTLCLTAALHGDETDSISVVMDILARVDVNDLSGTIVALPVANPPALEFSKYYNPCDGMNLDFQAFPGNPRGTLTQQIAAALAEIVTKENVDALVDVHSVPRSFPGLRMNYLYITPAEGDAARASEELALVQGYEILYRGAPEVTPGSFVRHAIGQGVPASYSNGDVQGIENVMRHLGMIEGEVVLPDRQLITQPPRLDLRPRHGGIVFPEFSLEQYPDQIVPEGTLLGRVISPYTLEELDRMVAPFEAAVLFWYEGRRPCQAGDYGYVVAALDGVERVRG
jgi:predicted deacylase